MHQQEDADFIDLLNDFRVGQLNMQHLQLLDERRQFTRTDFFAEVIHVFPTLKQVFVESFNAKVIDKMRKTGVEMFVVRAKDESREPKTYRRIPNKAYIPKDTYQQNCWISITFTYWCRIPCNFTPEY